jgi:hypothetical protein
MQLSSQTESFNGILFIIKLEDVKLYREFNTLRSKNF